MQKSWMKIAIAAVALVVLVVVIVPFLVNADTFRPTLQSQLSSALGRPVTLGHLSFSLFRGSLVAENISIADDPAFSTAPFLDAKSLSIGVEVGALLLHHQVSMTKLTVDSPSINLISKQNGVWNFSSLGRTASSSAQSQSAFPNLTVGELKIVDGTATVSSIPAVGEPFTYSAINLDLQQFSFLKAFPFQLSAMLPGSGSLNLNGNAGPVPQSTPPILPSTPLSRSSISIRSQPGWSSPTQASQWFSTSTPSSTPTAQPSPAMAKSLHRNCTWRAPARLPRILSISITRSAH